MLPEVRMARVLDAISSHRAGRLSWVEAVELLGFSERHFRRLRDAFEERGEDGLLDRRRGRVSARAAEGGGGGMGGRVVPHPLFRRSDQTLPRIVCGHSDGEQDAVSALLHLDQERVSVSRSDDDGTPARGSQAQARAASLAWHDAVSGWLDPCVARRRPGSGPKDL